MSVNASVAVVGQAPTARRLIELSESAGHPVERIVVVRPTSATFMFVSTDAVPATVAATAGDTVVVACTTLDSPTELARETDAPARVVGLHLFVSAPGTALAEIVPAEQSTPDSVERLSNLLTSFGLAVIVAKDRPGFLVQRLFLPYLNQAVQALDDGVASATDIDAAVELGLGYPIGP